MQNDEEDLGAVSATEGAAVPCSVPADQLSHAELLQMAAEWRLGGDVPDRDWIQALAAGAAALREQGVAIHNDCHDLVCNGDRRKPRGARGVSCSCRHRDGVHVEKEQLLDLIADCIPHTPEGIATRQRISAAIAEHYTQIGSATDSASAKLAGDRAGAPAPK